MTTKGVTWRRRDGSISQLTRLPELVAMLEGKGHPVIVEVKPGELSLEAQRLYATLGVLIRFVEPL